jgi:ribonuclease-3
MKLLLKILGHEFKNPTLLTLALTHRSVGAENNERLEFLGDAVLNFVVAAVLFHHYPHATEGQLSRLRSKLVNQEYLADIAMEFDLGKYLKLGQGEIKSGGVRRKSILSDTLEAIIGAVYLDGGFLACEKMLKKWFVPRLDDIKNHKIETLKDPKSRLQEYCQSKKISLPHYTVTAITGASHRQEFHILCEISALDYHAKGVGASRRQAEQIAAEKILALFK